MEILLFLGIGLLVGAGGMYFFPKKTAPAQTDAITKLQEALATAQKERDTSREILQEKKEHVMKLEERTDQLRQQLQKAEGKISNFESREEQMKERHERAMERAAEMQRGFEEQKKRLIDEAKRRQEKLLADRDRVWNEHEMEAIVTMKSVCKGQGMVEFYENTNLPEGFDGKLKPDFLVAFLGQYIIFDAKMKKPDSKHTLHDYLRGQAQSTAKKIRESQNAEEIYKTVFFVVPSVALQEVKQVSFHESGIEFYIISSEGFEPLLALFQKVTEYKNLDKIDPQERENIVEALAKLDRHVNWQNSVSILSSARGIMASQEKERLLSPEMLEKVNSKRDQLRIENLKPKDLKRLIESSDQQIKDWQDMVRPKKPDISTKELEDTQTSLL